MKVIACVLLFVFVLFNISYVSTTQITNLPGIDKSLINFNQYSGYITINETAGRNMFYWFVESQNDPKNDPVVLWQQGGPGCSSLIGLMTENGPFRPAPEGGLMINDQSWNRIANVLYLDAPLFVGYSYSDDPNDRNSNDNKTAHDNYLFLENWYKTFSNFSTNKLYLTGESFGGDYVPQLAAEILNGSNQQLKNILSGLMIGNPVMSCPAWTENHNSVEVELYYYHGLVSYMSLQRWRQNCDVTNPDKKYCDELYIEIKASIGRLDGDNLYTNFCTGNATLDLTEEVPDCVSAQDLRDYYLNTLETKEAIYANTNLTWLSCTTSKELNYTTDWPNMLPYYEKFFDVAPNLRILIYSGDVDIDTCPHAYTQLCLSYLPATLKKSWRPWHVNGDVTAGYVEEYNEYTYATVKGAGHEVPQYSPYLAYQLYSRFLNNESI
eukprot:TRINITY_DN130_c3_g1_i1.p1 TRINITY_DN130_c3_g1~~TRINITY_DN130_c3_g1_i1.p1  ORF type:complete len:438 (-),score=126.42 TRINITY_DN130_c3_g1_i1:100-1413(-)